ncbi:MAG: hypothetical protein HOV77_05820 [Hamadaea sp.]|uniref:helix-turn-helix domain-containing protein n=1 Tax=Hamadaea sp. TaxID=2024425 RepID=UPI0017D0B27A|nr:helix-turn-helix domain-containing protein [Hamadaea sp.]NUT18682.1 hypothetical protein [Hamadaea sp.]
MFDVLGLSSLEERAYRRLLALASAASDHLATAIQADPAAVGEALTLLEEKGLVARSTATPSHYVAAPPDVALGSLIVQRQDDIGRAQLEIMRLAEQYRTEAAARSDVDVVDVVRGRQAIAQRFAQLQRSAKTEVRALLKPAEAVVSAEENTDEDIALERGVRYRVVVDRAAFADPRFVERAADSLRLGETIRVTGEVPLRMVIADHSLALLPLLTGAGQRESGALLIHPSGLLDALITLFELVWAQANEILPSPTGITELAAQDIDETDARILGLLLAGITDQAIGSQLGKSLRTVQRRIGSLMERTGAVTRFQLGHEAARRGWIG